MRSFHFPTGASVYAALLGAGVVDAANVVLRSPDASVVVVAALGVGIYGAAGLVLGAVLGWAVAIVLGALPPRLSSDPEVDHRLAAAIVAGLFGALALAVGAGVAHGMFVAQMASKKLAVIATGGLALALIPVGLVVALAFRRVGRTVAG